MVMKFLFLFFFISPFFISSQIKLDYNINWTVTDVIIRNQKFSISSDSSIFFEGVKPIFASQVMIETNNLSYSIGISSCSTFPAPDFDKAYLSNMGVNVPTQLEYRLKKVSNGSNSFLKIVFFPYIIKNGQLHSVSFVSFLINSHSTPSKRSTKFVSKSVLNTSNATFYKINVSKDGFYKVLGSDFLNMGISLKDIDTSMIHIFGNGIGMLPEKNDVFRPDDLIQNAIHFEGLEDGVFDPSDYVYFYAKGPDNWINKGSVFFRNTHIYSSFSSYFICVSNEFIMKKITKVSQTSAFNKSSSSYNYYVSHELDELSLLKSGQRWYGELFDYNLTKSYSFQLPSPSLNNIEFDIAFASNVKKKGSKLDLSINSKLASSYFIPINSSEFLRNELSFSHLLSETRINLLLDFKRLLPSELLYLDFITINAKCENQYPNDQYSFRDLAVAGIGNVTQFKIKSTNPSLLIYDVTNQYSPKNISLSHDLISASYLFSYPTDSVIEFAVLSKDKLMTPTFVGSVASQNLHGLDYAQLIIITPDEFIIEANRLASIHSQLGDKVHVVTPLQIYNEFSSGMLDPTAIKFFIKMFYDRFNNQADKKLKNVLLFGDGTYDPKNRVLGNNNFIPTYQFLDSEDHVNSMVSDDYYGLLDDSESIESIDDIDVGIGRMIISSRQQAQEQLVKIENYLKKGMLVSEENCCKQVSSSSFGDWRMKYVQLADDEEGGYFVSTDAEPQSQSVDKNFPMFNANKLYMDAYQQSVSALGERYPELENKINSLIDEGVLIFNYIGHGGEVQASEEKVITIPKVLSWENTKYPLFVTATCQFTKYDDPGLVSVGEWIYLNPKGGGIALMTTSRAVYFGVNSKVGERFYKNVFLRDADQMPLTFGEIIKNSKNQAGGGSNKRSFTLIGDPALRLALPMFNIKIDSIQNKGINNATKMFEDTLNAMEKVVFSGRVLDWNNNLKKLNGQLVVSFFDKPMNNATLGQNISSPKINFKTQEKNLFKGMVTVKEGLFKVSFILPKDIGFDIGKGKISVYANDYNIDAGGQESNFYIGGVSNAIVSDTVGPNMTVFLNDSKFVNGGLVDANPFLVVKLDDTSGVNMSGNGIGHDMLAVLDGNVTESIVLNQYYQTEMDSYKKGYIKYPMRDIPEGNHRLKVKVWDVFNNSSEQEISFQVARNSKLELARVYNYPNPFVNSTHFYFDHNENCTTLEVDVKIYSVSGKLVKTITKIENQIGNRSQGIFWDGKDEYGSLLAKGVYVYIVNVKDQNQNVKSKTERLVIF